MLVLTKYHAACCHSATSGIGSIGIPSTLARGLVMKNEQKRAAYHHSCEAEASINILVTVSV
jgi:hypothetical protein